MLAGIRRLFARRPSSDRVDCVAPWLYLGPALDRVGYAALAARGVTHVLDLRAEETDDAETMTSLGLTWRHLPTPDRMPSAHADLESALAWIETSRGVDAEPTLYVHCSAGIGRSPTFAMALLMRRGLTLAEAHRLVTAARPATAPNAAQLAWLAEVETRASTR